MEMLSLRKGRIIRPQDIAVMASVGHTSVMVSRMPRVGVISSGSELVEPHYKPREVANKKLQFVPAYGPG